MSRKIKETYDLYPTRGDDSSTTFYLPAENIAGQPVGMTPTQIKNQASLPVCLTINPTLDFSADLPVGDTLPAIIVPYNYEATSISCRFNLKAPSSSSLVINLLYGTTLNNAVPIMDTYPLVIPAGQLYDDGTAVLTTTTFAQYGLLIPYIVSGNPSGTGKYPRIFLQGAKY